MVLGVYEAKAYLFIDIVRLIQKGEIDGKNLWEVIDWRVNEIVTLCQPKEEEEE